jgi:hypothetical protein
MLHEMGGSIEFNDSLLCSWGAISQRLTHSPTGDFSRFLRDQFVDQNDKTIYWEDVAKFIGICFWAAFFISRSVWVLVWTVDGRGSEKTL